MVSLAGREALVWTLSLDQSKELGLTVVVKQPFLGSLGRSKTMQHTHLLTPEREPRLDQSNSYTNVQMGELVSFWGNYQQEYREGSYLQ